MKIKKGEGFNLDCWMCAMDVPDPIACSPIDGGEKKGVNKFAMRLD